MTQLLSTQQITRLADIVSSGIRQFYYPPKLPSQMQPHSWSFLHPVATLDLPSGVDSIPLPDDFGGFEGLLTVQNSTTSAVVGPVKFTNEGRIRQCYAATPNASGPPLMASERHLKGTTAVASNRSDLFLFPITDQAYTAEAQYYINPDMLDGNHPYVYGGPEHAETILESILAIAEQRLDNAMTVHTMKYMQRLEASIGMDMKHSPLSIGYNRDRSDYARRRMLARTHSWIPQSFYNGAAWD